MQRELAKPIPRLRRSHLLLLLGLMLQFLGTSVAHSQTDARALLRLNYLATGGERWKALAQAEETGDLNLGGAAGTFHQIVDLKSGRDATTLGAGPLHIKQVSLTDSSWQLDQSGLVSYADTPDAKADAIDQSFIDRNGWFTGSGAELRYLGARQDQGQSYQLISAVPRGGRSMTLWLGTADHLLHRIDQLDASHQQNSLFFSEYRRVAGVLVPYSVRQSNGTASEDTIQTVKTVRFSSTVNTAAFIAPSSRFQDATLLAEGEFAAIPFTPADGRICVNVSIDGQAPLPFLLDTGARNFITLEAAKALGLKGRGNLPLGGTGEAQENGQFAMVKTLRLGPVQMTNQQFLIGSLPAFLEDRGKEPPIAGLVGAELLRRFPTTFDYQHKTLTFYRPGSSPPETPEVEGVKLLFNVYSAFLPLLIDGVPGVFGIDTGDNAGTTLFHPFYEAHRFPVEQPGVAKLEGGIGGENAALLTRIASIQLGRSVLDEPLITLSFAVRGGFSQEEIAGNLGYQFLRNFVFTLDYEHRVGYFARSEDFGRPAEYNRSGLSLDRAKDGSLIAKQVNPGTPAAEAGVQTGDSILQMNGERPEGVARGVFDRMLSGQTGSPISLVISHDGQERTVTFTLQELLPAHGR